MRADDNEPERAGRIDLHTSLEQRRCTEREGTGALNYTRLPGWSLSSAWLRLVPRLLNHHRLMPMPRHWLAAIQQTLASPLEATFIQFYPTARPIAIKAGTSGARKKDYSPYIGMRTCLAARK